MTSFLRSALSKLGIESREELVDQFDAWWQQLKLAKDILEKAQADWEKLEVDQIMNPSGTFEDPDGDGGLDPEKIKSLLREIEDEQIKQIADAEDRDKKKAKADARRRIEDLKDVVAKSSEKRKLTKEINETLGLEITKIEEKYAKKREDLRRKSLKALANAKVQEKMIELNAIDDTIENLETREDKRKEIDALRIKEIEDVRDLTLENTKLTEGERRKIIADSEVKIDKITEDATKRREAIQKRHLDNLNKIFGTAEAEKRLELLRSDKTDEEVEEAFLDFQIDQLEKLIAIKKEKGLEILADEVKLEEMRRQRLANANKEETDNQKEFSEKRKAIIDDQIQAIQTLTEVFVQQADKRIDKIQEEINMAKKRYDNYVELAKNGNITAKESLAVEAKLIAEQNRLKEKEERRKQRVELASSVLQSYLRNTSDPNVANPLGKTITDTVLLTEFIKNLPLFEEGTEDTGKSGRGVDGRGGFHAILHPNERVLTKKQNSMVGNLSNEELSKLAYNYQNGLISQVGENAYVSSNTLQTDILAEKLDSLENTIRNKPETNIELEEIIGGAMAITRQTKEGNTKIYNRYRVK
jgi:hypothetical protein